MDDYHAEDARAVDLSIHPAMMAYSATNETERNAAETQEGVVTQSIASNDGMDDEDLEDEDQEDDCLD